MSPRVPNTEWVPKLALPEQARPLYLPLGDGTYYEVVEAVIF